MRRVGDDHIQTPVLIVAPDVLVLPLATLKPGTAYLIDGETYVVNGERPFSKDRLGDTISPESLNGNTPNPPA